jgi:carbamoyl-phosphate synthase large subunit
MSEEIIEIIKVHTRALALSLKVIGLLNIQFAIKGEKVLVLEVNPRASRTVPFVSKAIGFPLAKIAARIMAGEKLSDFKLPDVDHLGQVAVKECVLPFSRFSGVDIILGPEMKSTGEVMGLAPSFGAAFAKSQIAANQKLPQNGAVFVSVNESDKRNIAFMSQRLHDLGFKLFATKGTAKVLRSSGVPVTVIDKTGEGQNNILTLIDKSEINLIINTPSGKKSQSDMRKIRAAAIMHNIPCITTLQGALAAVHGIESSLKEGFTVQSLQQYYQAAR